MKLDIVTIFPDYLQPLRQALLGKAIENNLVQFTVHDLRQWAQDVHKSVDDSPYGGGPGMVMKPSIWGEALDDIAYQQGKAVDAEQLDTAMAHKRNMLLCKEQGEDNGKDTQEYPLLIVPTPAGIPFTQELAAQWSQEEHIVFACGRYEGIDQRVIEDAKNRYRVVEVSIGDYVLIGGEVATLVISEAIIRLIPGVLGNASSHQEDSFQDGLLEGPCYTRPQKWRGLEVPPVLLSGNHAKVDSWRREQSLIRTKQRRPELLDTVPLTEEDKKFLDQLSSS